MLTLIIILMYVGMFVPAGWKLGRALWLHDSDEDASDACLVRAAKFAKFGQPAK